MPPTRAPRRPPRRRHGTASRWGVLALVAFAILVVTAEPAAAHTQLVSSTPAAGATVTELRSIELRFSESLEVGASHVWIEDAAGFLDLGPASAIDGDPASLTVAVPALGEGTYSITWHVLADDGAPAQGTFAVTLAAAAVVVAPPVTLADPAADFPPDTSLAIPVGPSAPVLQRLPRLPDLPGHGHLAGDASSTVARGLLDASLSTLIGGLAFITAVWPQGARLARSRQLLWIAALLAAFASFELLAFQHAAATGLSTAQAFSPWHQWEALRFRFGRIAAARMALLVLSTILTARLARDGSRAPRSAIWCTAATVVALGLAETLVLLGHSSASGALASGARLLHVLGVSVWIGGLVMLLVVVVPRRRVDELVAVLPRFAALASGAVALLTLGGLVLAVDLVGAAGALPSTGYGRLLLAKVAMVGVLLAVASRSRRHVRTSLLAPTRLSADSVARPLAVWVGTEVGLVVVVLGLTAVLVSTLPPV